MKAWREAWSLHLVYHAEKPAVDAVEEIKIDKSRKNNAACAPHLQTAYRSRPGQLTWLQSRTQVHVSYKCSRCASAASNLTIWRHAGIQ